MNSGFGIRIGLNLSEAHLKDAKESLSEDIHTHFARPQFPINESNGNFFDAESKLSRIVFHFDLKGIADELNPAEVDALALATRGRALLGGLEAGDSAATRFTA